MRPGRKAEARPQRLWQRHRSLKVGAKPWLIGFIQGCKCGSGEGGEDRTEQGLGAPGPRFLEEKKFRMNKA